MESGVNKTILLASRPTGMPTTDNFKLVESELPEPSEGEVLVKTLYLSVDPYMRGRMNDSKSYVAPFVVGEMISGGVIGEVLESKCRAFQVGDIITGHLGWQLYSVAKGEAVRKVDPRLAPITTALGALGMTGLTAYFGLLEIGRPMPGETIVVSGAAGAVGTIVCQIAKIKGCRVVGIAGTDHKRQYLLRELGVDAAINYKKADDMGQVLTDACPKGLDVYFDNVGGRISDVVMKLINQEARIVICGQISLYNLEKEDTGPRVQPLLLVKRALMKGFIVSDFAPRFAEAINQLAQWLAQRKLKYAESIIEGFEKAPEAFLGLFAGDNLGKQLVKVAAESNQ